MTLSVFSTSLLKVSALVFAFGIFTLNGQLSAYAFMLFFAGGLLKLA